MSCRVLLVDDHPLMRRGINQLLSFEEEFEVVAEAGVGLKRSLWRMIYNRT